jgi:ribonuclease HIII
VVEVGGREVGQKLFSIIVYRSGHVQINGHGRREALPEILRMIAQALETGELVLERGSVDD